jgi:hypothetical protein
LGITFSTSVAHWAKRFFLAASDNPLAWFQLSATYAAVVWLLFAYDMRLIHARIAEARNDADRALYARAKPTNCSIFVCWFLCFFYQPRLRARHLDLA